MEYRNFAFANWKISFYIDSIKNLMYNNSVKGFLMQEVKL